MATRLACAAKTDVGLKRSNNEDNLIMVPSHGLYVLADGMGGHASGQVASTMCVSHVAEFICKTSKQPGFEFPYKTAPELSFEAKLLVNAIKFANERVFIQSCKDRSMEGMGTTVTAILNAPQGLILAHVGDSRIYRVRNGQIKQMTRDHSLLNHLLDKGELKPEDAAGFANKNVILRAIGLKDYVDVEVQEIKREQGDVYMMCSDGLSDIVSDALISQAISSNAKNLPEACNALIALALKAGGKDNVTVVCVSVEQDDGVPMQAAPNVTRMGMSPVAPGMMPPGMQAPGMQPGMQPSMQVTALQPGMQPGMQVTALQPGMQPMGGRPMNMGMPTQSMGRMPAVNGNPQFAQSPNMNMGMAPMPGRMSMPMAPAIAQMQPQVAPKPQRMHSVREIVERRPTPKPMPKPIGSAGRTSSGAMPTAPGMNKIKAVSPTSATEDPVVAPTPAAPATPPATPATPPPTPMTPPPVPAEIPVEETYESIPASMPPTPHAQEDALKEISHLTNEEKAELPETALLFTEAPLGAPAQVSDDFDFSDFSNLEGDDFEDDDNDNSDNSKTIVECPVITDDMLNLGPHAYDEDEDEDEDDEKTRVTTRPEDNFLQPPKDDDINDFPAPPPFRGYVAPKEAIVPPKDDFEDDDSIEIGPAPKKQLKNFCFEDDDDDDDVTRQFKKPPFGYKNNNW